MTTRRQLWTACIIGDLTPQLIESVPELSNKDPAGRSAASRAAMWGRSDVLTKLHQAGVDLSADIDRQGNTLLHVAASHAQHQTCSVLLGLGLSVSCLNKAGQDPLTVAQALPDGRLFKAETIAALSSPQTTKKANKK